MFFKLKASLAPLPRADDGDRETRRRHRLSKPLTNKSSANLLILVAQQAEGQSNNSSSVDVSPCSLSTPPSSENAMELANSPLSHSKQDLLQAKSPIFQEEVWKGSAFILNEDSVQGVDSPTLLSPRGSIKAKRPLSAIFTSHFSSSRKASDFAQRRASLQALTEGGSDKAEKNRSATTLPCSSDNQSEALSPRLHRRSSFTPGVATRMSRKASLGPSPEEEQVDAGHDYYYNPTLSEESPLSLLEVLDFDEEWTPPAPPVARSETPADLDYTHLGGLRLGSLRVVNGRASPAPSELSRHLTGASTPNFKRDASSEYGDGEDGALVTLASLRLKSYRGRDQGLQDSTPIPRKPVAVPTRIHNDTLLLPKRAKANVDTSCGRVEPTSSWVSVPQIDIPLAQPVSHSPDKTSELAMAYMAELCASPYSAERPTSPAESVLKSTSKTTEFDDNLFEDDAADLWPSEEVDHLTPDTHYASSDAVWVYETAYRMSVKRSRDSSRRSSLQPSNSTGSSVKPDSGYGSKISLQSSKSQTHEAAGKTESSVPKENVAQAEAPDIEMTRGRSEPRRSPMPSRPSILKRSGATAPELPTFSNLYPSTTTLATIKSTSSAPSDAPAKLRKLQKKARPQSQPPAVRQIVLQGHHQDMLDGDIPPIPAEIAANLAIRSQQVPELGHTFSSMHHTRETESSPKQAYAPTYIDFPSTDPGPPNSLTEVNLPFPPQHRSSFIKWSKNERRNSQRRASNASGISESDAMAIIRNLDTAVSSMGGSPYDVASRTTKPASSQIAESKTPDDLHNRTRDSSRPRSMMDDATAAELARLRSRTILERDSMQWKHRRSSFNDRGGIPGRNIRPMSTAGDAPPLPPLPSREQVMQREVRRADYQRPYLETRATERKYWPEQFSSDPYERPAPPPLSHSPRPRPIELEDDIAPPPPSHSPRPRSIERFDDTQAPPPPSHSPRPRSMQSSDAIFAPPPPSHSPCPMSVGLQEEVTDIWAAQASAWKSRRKSIGEILRSRTSPPEEQCGSQPFSTQEYAIEDPIYPEIPLRRPQKSFTTGREDYRISDWQFHGAEPEPLTYEPAGRSGLSYGSFIGDAIDRPHSRLSQAPSHAGSYVSLAEELHQPPKERPQPPPQFGRYSGGLNYGYEHGAGFGGSAGTRSISGVAKATRKGLPLSQGFGVDLSDVPIIAGIRRKPVG
jgi:hypothetical protein